MYKKGIAAFSYYVGIDSLAQVATPGDHVCVLNILGTESRQVTPVSHAYSRRNVAFGTSPGRKGEVLPTKVGATLSRAVAGGTATASSAFALLKKGTSIGTVTFAAEEAAASFSVTAAVDFAAGDVLALAAPDPQDATLADIALTLVFGFV